MPSSRNSTGGTLVKVVMPSIDHRYAPRSQQVMDQILKELAFRESANLVVCYGLYGSPLDRIHHILADMFDQNIYLGYAEQLTGYRFVESVDTGILCQLDRDEAATVLQNAIHKLDDGQRVLVFERFERLADISDSASAEVRINLLRILARTQGAPLIALFQKATEDNQGPRESFPNLRMKIIEVKKYLPIRTDATIDEYYRSEWRNQGFTLSSDALSTIYSIEPGVFADGFRKTLPYLAIDLIKETITTLRAIQSSASSGLAFSTIMTAHQRLEDLLKPGGQVIRTLRKIAPHLQSESKVIQETASDWALRCRAIEDAERDIASTIENMPRDSSLTLPYPFEITKTVINAQFFSMTKYELDLERAFALDIGR